MRLCKVGRYIPAVYGENGTGAVDTNKYQGPRYCMRAPAYYTTERTGFTLSYGAAAGVSICSDWPIYYWISSDRPEIQLPLITGDHQAPLLHPGSAAGARMVATEDWKIGILQETNSRDHLN